jgi:large subunit ribosomal protein L5
VEEKLTRNKMNRLKEKYIKEIAPALEKEFGVKNVNAVPKLMKIVVNSGVGAAIKSKELMEQIKRDMATITGQATTVRQAHLSVASFAVRQGMPVGLKVTLRGDRMYAFLDRLVSVVLPRFRDFRGVPAKGFDAHGNFTLGIVDQTVFPEIDITKSKPFGFEITMVTSSKNKEHSFKLVELLGMPFEKEN